MPVGDRRSRPSEPPHLLGVRAETELSRRLGSAPLRPCGPLCRPEVGVPLPAGPSLPVGSAPRREPSRRLGFRPPRRCAPLCRAPPGGLRGRRSKPSSRLFSSAVRGTHAGRMERHRYWFRAPARCRSETGAPASPRLFSVCGARHSRWRDGASSARVSRSRAMPVGDRRSRPSELPHLWGSAPRGEPSCRLGFRPPRPCGPLCRAPPEDCGFRSLACVLCCPRGYGPRGEPSRRLGFRPPRPCAPARCRSETGAPGVSLLAAPPREAGGPGRRPPWGDACRV